MTDAAPAAPADANPGTASGIALDELDPAVRPQDDLFRHVNGKWIDRTEIPSDKARYGSFYLLAEAAEQAVRELHGRGAHRGTRLGAAARRPRLGRGPLRHPELPARARRFRAHGGRRV